MLIFIGLIIPFIGTTLGACMVLVMRSGINSRLEKFLGGFASGVMISASMFSLLMPAIEMSENSGVSPALTTTIGFSLGVLFLFVLDLIIPHMHRNSTKPEGKNVLSKKSVLLSLAVTMHNIPEGMAVGAVFAGILGGVDSIALSGAMILSIGIAVQNFPEGAIISLPLNAQGVSKMRAFTYGTLSGIVEPIAGALTLLLTSFITFLLPYLLSFAAGAMIYVVVEELIPDSQQGLHSNFGTLGATLGFALMMVLDLALG